MLIMAVILTFLMITVMITDMTHFIIPNSLVIAILLLYPILLYTAPVRPDWKIGLLIALAVFAAGFLLFAFQIMGGGDIKLLVAASLFAGKDGFPEFIMGVGIFGGLLAVILLLLRQIIPYLFLKLKRPPTSIPRLLTTDQPAPYGVAIATAFLIVLWSGKIPGIIL